MSEQFVLDTNVISALRLRGRNPSVESWAASIPVTDLFVTTPTVAEIERGVFAKERLDPKQGFVLRRWFEDHVLPAFADRVLAFDLAAARRLGSYRVPDRAPLDDALVASIADSRGMCVATRNTRHFAPLGVEVVNPFT